MDIGTDKPDVAQMAAIPHHLFNIINPDEDFGLAQYQELARPVQSGIFTNVTKCRYLSEAADNMFGRYWRVGKCRVYLRIGNSGKLRKILAAKNGIEGLYRQLQDIDPESAQKIDKRNIRRVIRALEVALHPQKPFSALQKKDHTGL